MDKRELVLEREEGDENVTEDEDEDEQQKLPFYITYKGPVLNFSIVSIWLVVGVCFGVFVEGWKPITTVYVLMQIITTVGYGDVTVNTDAMHIFMAFYVVFGIAFVANIMNDAFNDMMQKHSEALASKFEEIAERLRGSEESEIVDLNLSTVKVKIPYSELLSSFLIFAFFVLFGTLFYGLYEDCSCSYGVSEIAGCKPDGYEQCSKTGGKTKDVSLALYMSLITLTTVGFGDVTPQSWWGRAVGIVWMFLGVLATGNLMATITKCITMVMHREKVEATMSRPLFRKIDLDGSGDLNRYEFLVYMVMKENLVTPDQFEKISDIFEYLDRNGDGYVTYDEVELALSVE